MKEKTIKIKGYKQIRLDVYRYSPKTKNYYFMGKNSQNLPLQEYVDAWNIYRLIFINQLKESLVC